MNNSIFNTITGAILKLSIWAGMFAGAGVVVCAIPFPHHLQLMDLFGVMMSGSASILVCLGVPVWLASASR